MSQNTETKPKPPLTVRARNLFSVLFSYHFTRKLVVIERRTPYGLYTSMRYRHAEKSPLLQLMEQEMLGGLENVEILVKKASDQRVDDTDLESVIISVRNKSDTLVILVTSDEVNSDDFYRLFRVFARHQVIILSLGKSDIAKLEAYVKKGNCNACIVFLTFLAERVTADPLDEMRMQGTSYGLRAENQKKATLARLDKMANLHGPQLRTLVKKLHFLLSYEKEGGEVSKVFRVTKISRKTFYLWCEKDRTFRGLLQEVE